MGDGGSYLVGFLVAVAMLMATYAGNTNRPHAVLAPLCVMAVHGYRHVPILSYDEKIVGIVSPQRVTNFLQQHFGESS